MQPALGDSKKKDTVLRMFVPFMLLPLAVIAVYSNTFGSPFILDDHLYIVNNAKLYSLGNFWPPIGTRYFGYLSLALNYRAGGLDVFGYHLVNIGIHAVNALLVFFLIKFTFRTPRLGGFKASDSYWPALATSLIFALHPVQTQAVTYITQRFASLAALFYLLALTLYVKWRLDSEEGRPRTALYVLSVVSTVFAMKTKEISFTLPAVIILYEAAFFGFEGLRKNAAKLVPFVLTMAIIPYSIYGPGPDEGSGISRGMRELQKWDVENLSSYSYLMTQFRAIVTYLRLFVLPVNQSLDYYTYPKYSTFFQPEVAASFLFLAFVVILAGWLFYRSLKRKDVYAFTASCGVFWFFITLSIESSVIPILDVIFEHRLYLPMAGAALALSAGILKISEIAFKGRKTAFIILSAVIIVFGVSAYKRNSVWKDNVTMYKDVISKDPANPRAHLGLGNAYFEMNRVDDAVYEFKTSLDIKPDYSDAMMSLGNVFLSRGMSDEAIPLFAEAIRLRPKYMASDAHYNLGTAFAAKRLYAEAIEQFKSAIETDPDNIDAYYNLANTYSSMNLTNEAIEMYARILERRPYYAEAHFNIANAYFAQGLRAKAREHYEFFLRTAPGKYDRLKPNVAQRLNAIKEAEAQRN